MKKIITSSIFVFTLLVSTIFSGSLASAQTTTTDSSTSVRCKVSQARLNTRIAAIDSTGANQSAIYASLAKKLSTLIASAESNGYPVTDLNKANDNVKAKITTYTEKLAAYQKALMATKNLSCGNSDGEYAASLTSTRAALLAIRTASLDLRTTFKTEAIPAVKDYAAWIKDQTATAEEKK